MKQELNTLRQREVPASLDAAVLSAARLSAFRRNKRQRAKRLIFAASGMAAAIAACFATFVTLPYKETRNEAQYYALNDLSIIEQESFALAAELNCRSVYALDNTITWEN